MSKNVTLQYFIVGLGWMRFFIPVLALFYIASDVSLIEFTIIMSVFSFVIFLLEIPSGIIADFIGKKKSMSIALFLFLIEVCILAFTNGFIAFLIAKIISGVAVSLLSGADSALLFDTLKKINRTKDHKKISGNLYFISNIFMAFTFVIGAVLFDINNKLPAIASIPFILICFILTLFLEEPYPNHKKLELKQYYIHFKDALDFFSMDKFVRYLVFYSMPIGSSIIIILSISSLYFHNISIPIATIGMFGCLASGITAIAARKTDAIDNKLGLKKSLFIIQMVLAFAILSMGMMIEYFGVVFYLLVAFINGFFNVLVNHYINLHISSKYRATILSIKNFFINLVLVPGFLIIGLVEKNSQLGSSLIFLGIFLIIYFIVLYFVFRTSNVMEDKKVYS